LIGYKFRVLWKATGLVETVNAREYDQARNRLLRRYPGAIGVQFVGTTAPVLPTVSEHWLLRMPRRVF
jgi:hypothetical protein